MPIETAKSQIRIRVADPDRFEGKFVTKKLKDSKGVSLIMGKIKGEGTLTVQSLRFDISKGWTEEKAKEWAKGHEFAEKRGPKPKILTDQEANEDPYLPDPEDPDEEEKRSHRKKEEMAERTSLHNTVILKDEKIFKIGKWGDKEFTEQDAIEMVRNHDLLKSTFLPPIGAGHDREAHKKIFGELGLGILPSIRYDRPFIYADFEIPEDIYNDFIKTKKLNHKSVVIDMNYKREGKEYGKVIKGLDFLGISTPAVSDLGQIRVINSEINSDNINNVMVEFKDDEQEEGDKMADEVKKDEAVVTQVVQPPAAPAVDEKAIAKMSELEAELKDKSEKLAKFSDMEKRFAELENATKLLLSERDALKQEKAMLEAKNRAQEINTSIEKLVSGGKVLPKQVKKLTELMLSLDASKEVCFSEDEKEVKLSQTDLLISVLDASEPQVKAMGEELAAAAAPAPVKEETKVDAPDYLKKYSEQYGFPLKDADIHTRALEIVKTEGKDYETATVKAYAEKK